MCFNLNLKLLYLIYQFYLKTLLNDLKNLSHTFYIFLLKIIGKKFVSNIKEK